MDYPEHRNKIKKEADTQDWILSFPRQGLDTRIICRILSPVGVYGIRIESDRSKVTENKSDEYKLKVLRYYTNEYGDRIGEKEIFSETFENIDSSISLAEQKIEEYAD